MTTGGNNKQNGLPVSTKHQVWPGKPQRSVDSQHHKCHTDYSRNISVLPKMLPFRDYDRYSMDQTSGSCAVVALAQDQVPPRLAKTGTMLPLSPEGVCTEENKHERLFVGPIMTMSRAGKQTGLQGAPPLCPLK
jgi:hypothetical protein